MVSTNKWSEGERRERETWAIFPVPSLLQYHICGRGWAVIPPCLQLSLGSGLRHIGGNGFPLAVVSGWLYMQRTVSLTRKTSYESKAWRKEERERDTQKEGNRQRVRQRKRETYLQWLNESSFPLPIPGCLPPVRISERSLKQNLMLKVDDL